MAGDEAVGGLTFDELYERHAGRIYAICLRTTGDPASAEEAAQLALIRIWEKRHMFDRRLGKLEAWIRRVTVNVTLNHLRGERRRQDRVGAVEDIEIYAPPEGPPPSEDRLALERAIRQLPQGARVALVLHDIEGYRHREIAEMLDVSVGTVKSQLHRARQLVRQELER